MFLSIIKKQNYIHNRSHIACDTPGYVMAEQLGTIVLGCGVGSDGIHEISPISQDL